MKKKYNIFIISRLYLKSYYKFLIEETNIRGSHEAFDLFMYSMKTMLGLDTIEYNGSIEKYGSKCIEHLDKTPDTPKNKNNIPFEDKVRIVSVCEGYAQVTKMLTYNTINNGRLKEG